MDKNKIIATIQEKIMSTQDEGLLFDLHPDDFNMEFELSKEQEQYLDKLNRFTMQGEYKIPSKHDTFYYLSVILMKDTKRKIAFNDVDSFRLDFWKYWTDRLNKVKSMLEKVKNYLDAETITDKDLIFTNVGGTREKQIYIDVFIITQKYFIRLFINTDNAFDRTEHIIQRDIKKISISDTEVDVHFHGLHDPLRIIVDDYKVALDLQRHLTSLREFKHSKQP